MIAIGSDHGGFDLKEYIKNAFSKNFEMKDFGVFSEEPFDYPIISESVAKAVSIGNFKKGIIICKTGIGVSIAANKIRGIRAAVCSDEISAEMSRKHNDANIICLAAAIINKIQAKKIVNIFLNTKFVGGRHLNRIKMIEEIEKRS